ncbi:MAG: TorF family putative porin [Pseudomonadota bacterium]
MKMKKIALACGVVMLGASAQSFAEVSMNIGATSNYIWRGVTQTGDDAAISGGLDWESAMGLYAGTWVSNVSGGYELDLYGGYAGEVGEFGYNAGLIYYAYDEDADADFAELLFDASWNVLSGGIYYTVSADNNDAEGDLYYYFGLDFDLPQDFAIGGVIGRYDFDAGGDYTHYQVDLSKSAGDFGDVTLSLSDTDMDAGLDEDVRFFVSWSKGF